MSLCLISLPVLVPRESSALPALRLWLPAIRLPTALTLHSQHQGQLHARSRGQHPATASSSPCMIIRQCAR